MFGADLQRADMRDANLTGVNLTYVALSHANLTGADLTNANLTGALLSISGMDPAILSGVIWSNTTCPNGVVQSTECPV